MKAIIDLSVEEEMRLVKLAQEGNRDVLNDLLIKYMPYIEKHALRYVKYGMEKDDMVQEGLVWLNGMIMNYKAEFKMNFRSYVCHSIDRFFQKVVADNNLISSNKFTREVSDDSFVPRVVYIEDVLRDYDQDKLSDGNMDPVFDEVMLGWVHYYIDVLAKCGEISEKQVLILKLYYWDNMSLQEIAKFMGCSKTLVYKKYCKILKKLIDLVNYLPHFEKKLKK